MLCQFTISRGDTAAARGSSRILNDVSGRSLGPSFDSSFSGCIVSHSGRSRGTDYDHARCSAVVACGSAPERGYRLHGGAGSVDAKMGDSEVE